MIVGQIGLTSLLVLYLYTERGWSATAAAVALGTVQLGRGGRRACSRAAGPTSATSASRRSGGWPCGAGVLLLAAAALADAPDAVLVPLLMGGGVLAMSWNGLSFTAAAEISGGAQAGRAMGMQNTLMRAAGAVVPVALGALAAHGLLARDVPGDGGRAAARAEPCWGRSWTTRTTAGASAGAAQRAVQPKSIGTAAPVKARPPGPARNATTSATSSGSISRLTACGCQDHLLSTRSSGTPWARAWSAIWASTSGVRTNPGQTALASTPSSAPSSASVLTSPSTPCLAAT